MKQIDCLTECNSACCHDVQLGMATSEQIENYWEQIGSYTGLTITGRCIYLDGNKCSVWNNKNMKFAVCDHVEPGDDTCLAFRERERYY